MQNSIVIYLEMIFQSSNLEINYQQVSNDTYLKVHDIKTELADKDKNIISKYLSYEFQDKKIFFGATFSMYDDLTSNDSR